MSTTLWHTLRQRCAAWGERSGWREGNVEQHQTQNKGLEKKSCGLRELRLVSHGTWQCQPCCFACVHGLGLCWLMAVSHILLGSRPLPALPAASTLSHLASTLQLAGSMTASSLPHTAHTLPLFSDLSANSQPASHVFLFLCAAAALTPNVVPCPLSHQPPTNPQFRPSPSPFTKMPTPPRRPVSPSSLPQSAPFWSGRPDFCLPCFHNKTNQRLPRPPCLTAVVSRWLLHRGMIKLSLCPCSSLFCSCWSSESTSQTVPPIRPCVSCGGTTHPKPLPPANLPQIPLSNF